MMNVPGACAILLCVYESNGDRIGMDAVRQNPFVIIGTPTVHSSGVSMELGVSDALTTFWIIIGRPPFQSGLLI